MEIRSTQPNFTGQMKIMKLNFNPIKNIYEYLPDTIITTTKDQDSLLIAALNKASHGRQSGLGYFEDISELVDLRKLLKSITGKETEINTSAYQEICRTVKGGWVYGNDLASLESCHNIDPVKYPGMNGVRISMGFTV